MTEIHEIDSALKPLFSRIVSASKNTPFSEICLLSDKETLAKQTYQGIYKIDVKTKGNHPDFASWIAEFRPSWDLEDYKKKFTCTTKDKRIRRHGGPLQAWVPLYIGKSKTVGSRVKQHIDLPLEARTFALKIDSRPNMINMEFRLSTIELDVIHYDLIAPLMEKSLRDLINPIVGKQ